MPSQEWMDWLDRVTKLLLPLEMLARIALPIVALLLSFAGLKIAKANKRIAESNREIAKVNFALLVQRAKVDFQHKSMDMLSTCDKIFAQLRDTEKEIALATKTRAALYDNEVSWKIYWLPFWELQLTQFEFYTLGYIPLEKFALWMSFRKNDWLSDRSVGDMTYKTAYEKARSLYPSSAKLGVTLIHIIEDIHKNSSEGTVDIITKHCRNQDVLISEYFHSRLTAYSDHIVGELQREFTADRLSFDSKLIFKHD